MLESAKRFPPDRVVFKGKPTDVFLHKLTTKDSIWFMWENRCETGPHAIEAEEEKGAADGAKPRKHRHRERAKETTFFAKYTFDVSNMQLTNPDADGDGNSWTFTLPAGPDSRIIRQLRKVDYDRPGVEYRLKYAGAYKFKPS